MLFREIIAVCCEPYALCINALYGQSAEWFSVKAGGAYTVRFFYRCSEHRSCHGMSQRMQAFCSIKLPCSVGLELLLLYRVTSTSGKLSGVAFRSRQSFPNIDLITCRVSVTSRHLVRAWMGDARWIVGVNACDTNNYFVTKYVEVARVKTILEGHTEILCSYSIWLCRQPWRTAYTVILTS